METAYNATVFMMGNHFNDHVDDGDILNLVTDATHAEIQIVLRVNPNIQTMIDVPMLHGQYTDLILLYQTVNLLRVDKEDTNNEIARKTKIFMKEIISLKEDVENTPEEEMGHSVIKDFLDQVGDLRKNCRISGA